MANLERDLFIKFNHLTDDFTGDSTILGASQKALKDGLDGIKSLEITTTNGVTGGGLLSDNLILEADDTVLRTSTKKQTKSGALTVVGEMVMRNKAKIEGNLELLGTLTDGTVPWERLSNHIDIIPGSGLTGGGTLDENRTIEVDSSVVRTSREIVTGSGLKGGGNLSQNRVLTLDNSVLRTNSTAQTKSGDFTVDGVFTVNNDITSTGEITGDSIHAQSNLIINFENVSFTPEAPLHVNGNAVIEDILLAKDDVQIQSDIRVKDDVVKIENALHMLKNINGYSYTLKNKDKKNRHIGVIAQEVMEYIPEVVREGSDGLYSVAYTNFVGVLIEAIKELELQNKENKKEIEDLKEKMK